MNELTSLHEVLSNIKDAANSIITNSSVILNQLLLEGDEVYDRFRRETESETTDDQIDEIFSTVVSAKIADAKRIKHEIDGFIDNILNKRDQDEDTLLYQVWTGDAYDNVKTTALVDLYEDLSLQDESFTLDSVLEDSIASIVGE